MGFISQKVKQSEIKAGDHLYTWRAVYTYSHHGIYVGGDKIVHFTQTQASSSSVNSSMFSSSSSVDSLTCLDLADCGFTKDGSGVVVSCLNCFIGTGSLYRFEYGVSTPIFIAKFCGGTCTTAKPDPPEIVGHRAMYLLHHKGFGNYSLFTNNCEDFALYCKTGRLVRFKEMEAPMGSSGQATSFLGVPLAAATMLPLRIFVSSPVVFAVSTAVNYSLGRYGTDIGVRDDVVEVRVEDIHCD